MEHESAWWARAQRNARPAGSGLTIAVSAKAEAFLRTSRPTSAPLESSRPAKRPDQKPHPGWYRSRCTGPRGPEKGFGRVGAWEYRAEDRSGRVWCAICVRGRTKRTGGRADADLKQRVARPCCDKAGPRRSNGAEDATGWVRVSGRPWAAAAVGAAQREDILGYALG